MADNVNPTPPAPRPTRTGLWVVMAVVIALLVGAAAGWYGKAAGVGAAVPAVSREAWEVLTSGDAAAGKTAFKELQCFTCHRVVGHPDLPAPTARPIVPVDLGAEKQKPTRKQLVDSILVPSHQIEPAFKESLVKSDRLSRMGDYSHLLSVRQLADLVTFLESVQTGNASTKYE